MLILLTAQPKTGKSTCIEKTIDLLKDSIGVSGVISQEILNKGGMRTGFSSLDINKSTTHKFASIDYKESPYKVGRFGVNIEALDNMVKESLIDSNPGEVLVIDEIGRMQSKSKQFLEFIENLLNGDRIVLGSITYENEYWNEKIKYNKNTTIIDLNSRNRDLLPEYLSKLIKFLYIKNNQLFRYHQASVSLFSTLFKQQRYLLLDKLCNKTLRYLQKNSWEITEDEDVLNIKGDNGNHEVRYLEGEYTCDCNFYRTCQQKDSNDNYSCSHIMLAQIISTQFK